MENIEADLQQINAYQQRINDSTKNGPVDLEAHQKQENLLQDLLSKGAALGSEIVYDVEEEKYKLSEALQKARNELSDEWHQFIARVSGQTVEAVKQAEQEIAPQSVQTQPAEVSTQEVTPQPVQTQPTETSSQEVTPQPETQTVDSTQETTTQQEAK